MDYQDIIFSILDMSLGILEGVTVGYINESKTILDLMVLFNKINGKDYIKRMFFAKNDMTNFK